MFYRRFSIDKLDDVEYNLNSFLFFSMNDFNIVFKITKIKKMFNLR